MAISEIFRKFMAKRADDSTRPQAGTSSRIRWPFLIAMCVILIGAVAWSFFMGLMVGRGQNPKSGIDALTGLEAAPASEELEKREPTEAAALTGSRTEPTSDPELPAVPLPTPETPALNKGIEPKPAAQRAIKPPEKKSQANQRFDYKFQAGAYRNQSEAQAASSNLVKNKFRSSVQKSGKVWLVIVNLRGGSKEIDNLIQKMKTLKMGKPMQLSKTLIKDRGR